MNISRKSEFGNQEAGRSKEAGGLSQHMDFIRVPSEITGSTVKLELCSPGPATPMQATALPHQKPREASKSCSIIATSKATHSFEAATEPQLASTPLKSLSASTQEAGQSHEEISSLLTHLGTVKHGVGHPSLSRTLVSLGGPTNPVSKDVDDLQLPSKTAEDEPSMSSCAVIERSSSDRSVTSMGRPSAKVKVESPRLSLDAGLCLGSARGERGCGEWSRVLEKVAGSAGQSGVTYVPSSRTEGPGVSESSQGRGVDTRRETGEMAMDDEWKGKHVEVSFGFQGDDKAEEGRVDGTVEHRFSEVLEQDTGVRVEHGAKACRDSSNDRWTKRVKREVVETVTTADQFRETVWEMRGDRDRGRSGIYENQHEHFRSLFLRNGGAALLPQGYREKALGRVMDVGCGEPRTMVVKKTPKRVHNSDPSAMFTRPELLMLEESARSPRSIPHAMFTSSIKQGVNGAMVASDLASEQRARKAGSWMCGGESGMEYMRGVQDCKSVQQLQLESRLDRGSNCSLMSGSKHVLSLGEAPLPLTLNFSPKPQRAVVSSCKTSTEEEWGKSLALCGPGAESAGEVERSGEDAKAMSYEERFVQLQVFLKKCDEDDQSYLLDALRSLSAAGRSSHAVGLEQRALWLSIEEGKEMSRLKSLNVMGQKSNLKEPSETGCTPQVPRVSSFGSGGEHPQQQLLSHMRTPELQMQMQMQMLMSGSKVGSAYAESYHSG